MTLLEEIEVFCARHDITPTNFGIMARSYPNLVYNLRLGKQPKPKTIKAVRAYMTDFVAGQPVTPVRGADDEAPPLLSAADSAQLWCDVQDYCQKHGLTLHQFGKLCDAQGQLYSLRDGRRIWTRNAAKIRGFIDDNPVLDVEAKLEAARQCGQRTQPAQQIIRSPARDPCFRCGARADTCSCGNYQGSREIQDAITRNL